MPSDTPQTPPKFYLTTPIYYVNARPHIGHAYTTIVADVLARRHRLQGDDTFFLTGTDEHGQKIERSAAAAGIPPQQFADEVSAQFRALWDRMGLTYNRYIRTTDPAHKQGAQQLFRELYNRGFIYLSTYTGSYCVSDEAFVDQPAGTPCRDCGRPLETVTEENFFFKLSELQLPLLDLIESNTLQITPDAARNEVLSFLRGNVYDLSEARHRAALLDSLKKENSDSFVNRSLDSIASAPLDDASTLAERGITGITAAGTSYVPGALKDLSISRSSFTWGVKVPEKVQQEAGATQPHVIYVWLDALANYMTAIGYGSDDPDQQKEFKTYWPADLHLVGKEITRFHCVYWPAFLLALNPDAQQPTDPISRHPEPQAKDLRIPPAPATLSPEAHQAWAAKWLPKQITANGWLLFDNAKMSKSKGNVVRTETILDAFGTLCPPVHRTTGTEAQSTTDLPAGVAEDVPTDGAAAGTNRKGTVSAVPTQAGERAALAAEVRPPTPHERDLFAADVLRYFLLREIPFGQDGSFSFDALVTRYNADLANGYGNLVSRTLSLAQDYFSSYYVMERPGGNISFPMLDDPKTLEQVSAEESVNTLLQGALAFTQDFADSLELNRFCEELMRLVAQTDSYMTANAPWKLAKIGTAEANKQLAVVLYTAAERIRIITALLYPILPFATARVWAQLGLGDIEAAARNGELNNLQWGGLQPGTKLGPLSPIFPRADKSFAQVMIDMEESRNLPIQEATNIPMATEVGLPAAKANNESLAGEKMPTTPDSPATTDPAAPPRTSVSDPAAEPSGTLTVGGSTAAAATLPTTPGPHTQAPASGVFANPTPPANSAADEPATITIDDFLKVDLRVAKVLVAERIPKADKLLRLEVDLGPTLGKRQILSGIAQHYTPEELIGRRIVVVANLAPRKMRGLDSHGMLLAASSPDAGPDGKPILATFGEDIALGSRVR